MSRLRIYPHDAPDAPMLESRHPAVIAENLQRIGVVFSRWHAAHPIAEGAAPEAVLAAYKDDIAKLMHSGGYQAVDVVSMFPEHPQKQAMRQKFLAEHTHAEDEIRFFVAGSGLFTIHAQAQVFEVLCEAGDLIHLPAGTQHWFDMGDAPFFVAIRIFNNPEGWVARFTGSDIASRFPDFERATA
jgi:1,2-dihydroxy-3-keto-5-methylthiopentene dioxygenase